MQAIYLRVVGEGVWPSYSHQVRARVSPNRRYLTRRSSNDFPILIVGGHVSSLPARSLREEDVDFACKGEGPATVVALLTALGNDSSDPRLDHRHRNHLNTVAAM